MIIETSLVAFCFTHSTVLPFVIVQKARVILTSATNSYYLHTRDSVIARLSFTSIRNKESLAIFYLLTFRNIEI